MCKEQEPIIPFVENYDEKIKGIIYVSDCDDCLIVGTGELSVEMLRVRFNLSQDQAEELRKYLYRLDKYDWSSVPGASSELVLQLVADLYQSAGNHVGLQVDPQAVDSLTCLVAKGAEVRYHSSRRGKPDGTTHGAINDELVAFIQQSELPQGEIRTIARTLIDDPTHKFTTTDWKVNNALSYQTGGKRVVVLDDDLRVCCAAANRGMLAIHRNLPHGNPKFWGHATHKIGISPQDTFLLPAGVVSIDSMTSLEAATKTLFRREAALGTDLPKTSFPVPANIWFSDR